MYGSGLYISEQVIIELDSRFFLASNDLVLGGIGSESSYSPPRRVPLPCPVRARGRQNPYQSS